ncbi:MAG: hypothetical protein TREMPRED_003610 [Tremellales sp. Tagirdzhanova-0007]|nr:MAG: hypothetical protein TREMPRED_003610 [Tremellales sp. Tagirdzhanova-0007]
MTEPNNDAQGSASTVIPSRLLQNVYRWSNCDWGPKRLQEYKEQVTPYCLGKAYNSIVEQLDAAKYSVVHEMIDGKYYGKGELLYSPEVKAEKAELFAQTTKDFRSDMFFSGQADCLSNLAKQADKKDLCKAFDEFGLSVSMGDPVKTSAFWSTFFDLASAGNHEDIELMKHDTDGCLYSRMRAVISRTHYIGRTLSCLYHYESCDNPHVRGSTQAHEICPQCGDPASERTHFKDFAKPVSDEINEFYKRNSKFTKSVSEKIKFIEKESSLADDYAYAWNLHQSNLPYSNRTEPKSRVQKWKQKLHSQTSTSGSEEGIWRPKYQSIHEILIPPLSIPEVRDDGTLPWEVLHDETLPLSTTGNETKDGAPAGT